MPSRTLRYAALAALIAGPIGAQEPPRGATIAGVVRDSADHPVANADVILRPGDRRMRTDTTGRFTFTGLDPDNYFVRARKLGFMPKTWDVKLAKSKRVDITIVLDRTVAMLDTIKIHADRKCAPASFEGFLCRQGRPGAVFLDDEDIDRKAVVYSAQVLKDVRGLHVDFKWATDGLPAYFVEPERRWECISSLVNGRPENHANRIPELAYHLIAVEVYLRGEALPPEYERYAMPPSGVTKSGKCTVIVYWTNVF